LTVTSPNKMTARAGNTLSSSNGMNKTNQKQMSPSSELLRSFKATTNLAHGLTKERIQIQNDLQKISAGR
jgi:hypothetical protein